MLFFSLTTVILAQTIDLEYSKGTEQDAVSILIPSPAQKNVPADVVIKVLFNVSLDPAHIKKNDVMLVHTSDSNKHIEGEVAYVPENKTVTFKPNKPLKVGVYELTFKSLKTVKEEKEKHIKEIKYRFYVPEVINGYMLPPEPDETINNSTLLGIDFNENGVRDDVELYVIKRFAKDPEFPKTKTAIAMQYAWASQKILENPTIESKKYSDDAIGCQFYWIRKSTKNLTTLEAMKFGLNHKVYNPEIKDILYNTRARIEQKFHYNSALSGQIFQGQESTLNMCQTNIDAIGA